MVGTRRNFNFFLEDGFLSETLLLPSLSRTCPSPLSLPFPLNLVLVEGEGWPFARNGREKGRWKGKKNFLLFKTQGRRWCQREREREREVRRMIEKEVGTKGKEGGGRYVRDIVKLVIMLFEARFISYCRERHCGL